MQMQRRVLLAAGRAAGSMGSPAQTPSLLHARRLQPGDTVALVNPSRAIPDREPSAIAIESLQVTGV